MEFPIYVEVTEPFDDSILADLRRVSERFEFHFFPGRKAEELPVQTLANMEILYTLSAVPQPEQVPNLKWVQFHLAGLDRYVDHPLLARGVQFTSLSGANAPQIAEFAVAMMLALGHCIPELRRAQDGHDWPPDKWERFTPRELRGATVGIVGYGSIGRETARLCHDFGARVLALKRDILHPEESGYAPPNFGDPDGRIPARLYPPNGLKRMLGECDFVLISAPLTGATRALFDRDTIGAMKKGSYLVDVSRGGIVAEDCLVEALQSGKLGGAALDVFEREPLPADSPLWTAPNLLLSPHIAGASELYDRRAADLFMQNLHRYLDGRPLLNRLDPKVGY